MGLTVFWGAMLKSRSQLTRPCWFYHQDRALQEWSLCFPQSLELPHSSPTGFQSLGVPPPDSRSSGQKSWRKKIPKDMHPLWPLLVPFNQQKSGCISSLWQPSAFRKVSSGTH
ncbi:uncharacterized protein ACBT57_023591 [Dama dama]